MPLQRYRVVVTPDSRHGNDLVPVKVDDAVGAGEHRRAAEVRAVEVLAGQAIARALQRMERRVRDGHGETLHQGGTLRVYDLVPAKALLDAIERVDGIGRWAVVVALQRLHQFGCGADDRDAADRRL